MKDKITPEIIKKAIKVLRKHKVTGDYEIRVNIVNFKELVTEIFKMIKQIIIGNYNRDLPITMLLDTLNELEKQIQNDLKGGL
jgi:glutamine amidotransferase-like uncharacterized protein